MDDDESDSDVKVAPRSRLVPVTTVAAVEFEHVPNVMGALTGTGAGSVFALVPKEKVAGSDVGAEAVLALVPKEKVAGAGAGTLLALLQK